MSKNNCVQIKDDFKNNKDLESAILQEKANGTPDIEIGRKYGVTFRYIEKTITKSKGVNVSVLKGAKKIKTLEPKKFEEEETTVWSFKSRGNWATHSGEYRGNWSPYIPRNVILKYSEPGETVLDYFCGAGTTAVEAKLLGRKCIALDINPQAIELAKRNIDFPVNGQPSLFRIKNLTPKIYEPKLSVGDARNLKSLNDNSMDLICAHPPYANIINYTDGTEGDLSFLDIDEFLNEMSKVAKETYRVLKPGRQCAILIGDTRRKKHIIPLGFMLIDVYLKAGFKLRELIIKRQHNCKTTEFWYANSIKYNFLLLAHEYLSIFEKPVSSKMIKERDGKSYAGTIVPTLEKLKQKRELKEFETTTVWIFPEKDFEKLLNKNIIDRYWNGHGYSSINLCPQSGVKKTSKRKNKKNSVIFIKSTYLDQKMSLSGIEGYLHEVRNVVDSELHNLTKGRFIVIQTQDVRVNDYVVPLAKKILDTLTYDSLWLKEIVFATTENNRNNPDLKRDYLRIAHRYLLIYEVKK